MNLLQFQNKFKDEKTCFDFLAEKRWGEDKAICPHCESDKFCKHSSRAIYTCKDCKKQYTARIGTIFEDSRLPLFKWFLAIYLATSIKKGISSIQLSKYIGTTQKTAWFMLQRIREVMKDGGDSFGGICEMDETYIGGKAENMSMKKRIDAKGVFKKTIAFGILERESKKVKAVKVQDTKYSTLGQATMDNVKIGSTIITDELNSYKTLKAFYNHEAVNHSAYEYVKKDNRKAFKVHTNGIEGFWSQLKRGIYGVYHWASEKHMQKYLNEFSFRYNNNKITDFERFQGWFEGCEGKRLVYKFLTR